jgi:hypothetical protein
MTEPNDAELQSEIEEICARIDAILKNIESHYQNPPPTVEVQE